MPEYVEKLFWEYKIESIDLIKHRLSIISRVLNFGDIDSWKWLFNIYREGDIIEAGKKRRDLTIKTAYFLQNIYGLKKEEMNFFESMKINKGYFW